MLNKKAVLLILSLVILSSLVFGCAESELEETEVKFKISTYLEDEAINLEEKDILEIAGEIIVIDNSGDKLAGEEVLISGERSMVTFSERLLSQNGPYKIKAQIDGETVAQKVLTEARAEIIEAELVISELFEAEINSMPAVLRPGNIEVNNYYEGQKAKVKISWDRRRVGNYPFRQNYIIYRTKASDLDGYPDTYPDEDAEPLVVGIEETKYVDDQVKAGEKYYYWLQGQSLSNPNHVSRIGGSGEITVKGGELKELSAPRIVAKQEFTMERLGEVKGSKEFGTGHDYQPYYRQISLAHNQDVKIEYKIGERGSWQEYQKPFTIDGTAATMFSPEDEQKIYYRAYDAKNNAVSKTKKETYVRTILQVEKATDFGEEIYFHYQKANGKWTESPGHKGRYIADNTWEFVLWGPKDSFKWKANLDGEQWMSDPDRTARVGRDNLERW